MLAGIRRIVNNLGDGRIVRESSGKSWFAIIGSNQAFYEAYSTGNNLPSYTVASPPPPDQRTLLSTLYNPQE
jgi:hypothetical protein